MANVLNFVLFQAGWFAFVWGAAQGRPWLGLPVLLIAVAVHMLRAWYPSREMALLLIVGACGMAWDSSLVQLKWLDYSTVQFVPELAPYWIGGLWLLFATTLNTSLSWLRTRPVAAAGLGAVGGPLAYLAAQRLGAVHLLAPTTALLALAVGWALLTPLLCRIAAELNGMKPEPAPMALPIYGSPETNRQVRRV